MTVKTIQDGDIYERGSWFYVLDGRWYQADGTYHKEHDEITEEQANAQGIFREVPSNPELADFLDALETLRRETQ